MEVPSWTITDSIAVCAHVQTSGNSDWDTVAAALDKPAALCALKWHVLYLAHQPDKLVTISKAYTDWELGVLLRGCHAPEATTQSQRTCHRGLAKWLPGRTAYGVKQAVKTHITRNKRKIAAKLAGWPKTLLGMLEAWPGPKQVLQKIQHTLLPDHMVAAQILAQVMVAGPESIDAPLLPVQAGSAPPAESPDEADSPITEASADAPVVDPTTQAHSSSACPAPVASCLAYEATNTAMFYNPECKGSRTGSNLSMRHDTLGMKSISPFAAYSSSSSDASGSPAVNQGHGFSWPDLGTAGGSFGLDFGPDPSQLQAANGLLSSNYQWPCAAAIDGGVTAAMRRSKFNRELHSIQQQPPMASSKRKASCKLYGMRLVPPLSLPPAAAAAGYVPEDAWAFGSYQQPNKMHCSRVEYPCTPGTVAPLEQQLDMSLELEYAMQLWRNMEQSIQPMAQGMQCTDPVCFNSFQACSEGTDSEAFLHEGLSPTTPVAGDHMLTPDWLAGIHLAGRDSSTDSVQEVLDSPLLSECSNHIPVPAWAAMQLTAVGGVASEDQHNELLDLLQSETPRQIASHQARAAVDSASLYGKHPLQQQHGQNAYAALATTAAAGGTFGCLTDADLAAAMHEVLAEPQELLQHVELQQQHQPHVQGNTYPTFAGEALQLPPELAGTDDQLTTLVSLASLDRFLGGSCELWMQEV